MNRPTIGLNLAYLQPGRLGGTETYARELIRELQIQNSDFRFVLFLNPESFATFEIFAPEFRKVLVPISSKSPAQRHVREQMLLPGYVRRERIDLLHSLGYVAPLLARCPQVVTVHDMLYEVHPELLSTAKLRFWRFFVPRSVRKSMRTITVSEASRRDIVRYCGIEPEKVVAIPLGVRRAEALSRREIDEVLAKYQIESPYVLAVGCGKHKGVETVEAACRLLNESTCQRMSLVVTGLPESQTLPPRTPECVYVGFVPAHELRALYAGAEAYVSASRMEGFGLTLLEAMMEGTPVISTTAGSLQEVGGDAVLPISDPTPEAFADAITRVCRDAEQRQRLIVCGYSRLESFGWGETARKHSQVYAEALNRSYSREEQAAVAAVQE